MRIIILVCISGLIFWGCDGDDGDARTSTVGDAGSGGVVGDAGSGGEAGSAGSGGDAGSAGSGGDAGAAGSGGDAGAAGSGGDAGSAGSGGDAGAAGSGGEAGTTGMAGEPGGDYCDNGDDETYGSATTMTPQRLRRLDSFSTTLRDCSLSASEAAVCAVCP